MLSLEHIRKVPPENSCDICKRPAPYYSVLYYIHICSQECLDSFENSILKAASLVAITKLKPMR